jgi:hypothetical protein
MKMNPEGRRELATPIYQQDYEGEKNITKEQIEFRALRTCVPACLFMLGAEEGYFDGAEAVKNYQTYINNLDWTDFDMERGWIRPNLAQKLRNLYGMEIVSWREGVEPDIEKMKQAGYLNSEKEEAFFKNTVYGKKLAEIVQSGYPVLVGVKPGFGTNKQSHGVIILSWTNEEVVVQDPDNRNPKNIYTPEYIESYLNPNGGGYTIVLPKEK